MPEIDTINKFMVSGTGREIVIMNPPRCSITADDALLLAAYLVAMAEPMATHTFLGVLEAVENT